MGSLKYHLGILGGAHAALGFCLGFLYVEGQGVNSRKTVGSLIASGCQKAQGLVSILEVST